MKHTLISFRCLSFTPSPPCDCCFVPREMCLSRQSPATAGARMRFRGLLSQSAFPIRLNALWRGGLLHDMILRVDKWPSMSRAGPHSWGGGVGGVSRQTAWGPRDESSPLTYWRFNQKQLALNQSVCRQGCREAFHRCLLKICKDWNADLSDI